MANIPGFSPAVARAYQRRLGAAQRCEVRTQLFLNNVCDTVALTTRNRMRVATEWVKNRVVKNISVPVTKITSPITGHMRVTERSNPGEFPRADTTQLMKTIFSGVYEVQKDVWEGFVGTPLDYGIYLELKLERQFLTRTLWEEMSTINRILSGPIK